MGAGSTAWYDAPGFSLDNARGPGDRVDARTAGLVPAPGRQDRPCGAPASWSKFARRDGSRPPQGSRASSPCSSASRSVGNAADDHADPGGSIAAADRWTERDPGHAVHPDAGQPEGVPWRETGPDDPIVSAVCGRGGRKAPDLTRPAKGASRGPVPTGQGQGARRRAPPHADPTFPASAHLPVLSALIALGGSALVIRRADHRLTSGWARRMPLNSLRDRGGRGGLCHRRADDLDLGAVRRSMWPGPSNASPPICARLRPFRRVTRRLTPAVARYLGDLAPALPMPSPPTLTRKRATPWRWPWAAETARLTTERDAARDPAGRGARWRDVLHAPITPSRFTTGTPATFSAKATRSASAARCRACCGCGPILQAYDPPDRQRGSDEGTDILVTTKAGARLL